MFDLRRCASLKVLNVTHGGSGLVNMRACNSKLNAFGREIGAVHVVGVSVF